MAVGLGVAASAMTWLGGTIALRLGNRLPLILGLTAGIVIGVALFDLVPEAMALGSGIYQARTLFAAVAVGLAAYMVMDRALSAEAIGRSWLRPHLGPLSLTAHSFLDGMGIGLAFQLSSATGLIIAIAVLAHDLADGINTVGLSFAGGQPAIARKWLLANSAAPVLGVLCGGIVRLSDATLAPLMAVFGGAFLYIGACELLPHSFTASRRSWTTIATVSGMALMYGVIRLAQR